MLTVADYAFAVQGSALDEAAIMEVQDVLKPRSVRQLQRDLEEARAWVKPERFIVQIGGIRNQEDADRIAGLTQIRFPRGRLIDVEDKILEALNQRKRAYEFRLSRA